MTRADLLEEISAIDLPPRDLPAPPIDSRPALRERGRVPLCGGLAGPGVV